MMKCAGLGSVGFEIRYKQLRSGQCQTLLNARLLSGVPHRTIAARAESVSGKRTLSGKSSGNNDGDKQEKADWVAKFFEGSDEDEPQWEQEPVSLKTKLVEALDREKERSKFWGRLAVLALGAVLLSERISGKGIVTALNMATGVPIFEIEPFLGLVVVAILAVGILPAFRKREEDEKENTTALDMFQVVTGRIACVALAGTILAEANTGKGILALLNINTGVEITEIEAGLTFVLLLLFTADTAKEKENDGN